MGTLPMLRHLVVPVLLGACLAPSALARPPEPPAAERAGLDRPGWSVAAENGCWLWNRYPRAGESVDFTGPCPAGPAEGEGEGTWRWTEEGRAATQRFGGTFRNGRLEGQGWQDLGEDGRYEGAFRNGVAHGQGVHVWPDGSRYEGLWEDDFPNGEGSYTDARGRVAGGWRSGCLFDGGALVMTIGRENAECEAFIPRLAPVLTP
jgi:hypothetical protein